jgi:hypothetical protein
MWKEELVNFFRVVCTNLLERAEDDEDYAVSIGIYICYVEESRPPLWSSSRSFWLHNGMYCDSCEVRTEFIYVIQKKVTASVV